MQLAHFGLKWVETLVVLSICGFFPQVPLMCVSRSQLITDTATLLTDLGSSNEKWIDTRNIIYTTIVIGCYRVCIMLYPNFQGLKLIMLTSTAPPSTLFFQVPNFFLGKQKAQLLQLIISDCHMGGLCWFILCLYVYTQVTPLVPKK